MIDQSEKALCEPSVWHCTWVAGPNNWGNSSIQLHYRTEKLASFALYKLNFSSRDNVTLAPKDTEARTLLNISENIFSYQNEKQFSPPNLSGYSLKNNISNCRKLSDASKFYLISNPQNKYKSFTLKQNAHTFKTQWDENKITYLKWHRPRGKRQPEQACTI